MKNPLTAAQDAALVMVRTGLAILVSAPFRTLIKHLPGCKEAPVIAESLRHLSHTFPGVGRGDVDAYLAALKVALETVEGRLLAIGAEGESSLPKRGATLRTIDALLVNWYQDGLSTRSVMIREDQPLLKVSIGPAKNGLYALRRLVSAYRFVALDYDDSRLEERLFVEAAKLLIGDLDDYLHDLVTIDRDSIASIALPADARSIILAARGDRCGTVSAYIEPGRLNDWPHERWFRDAPVIVLVDKAGVRRISFEDMAMLRDARQVA